MKLPRSSFAALVLVLAACETPTNLSGPVAGPASPAEARLAAAKIFPKEVTAENEARESGKPVIPPRCIQSVRAEYPAAARPDWGPAPEARVWVTFVVTTAGKLERITLLNYQHNLYGDAALKAVRQWIYAPGKINGTATPMVVEVVIIFGNYL